MKKMIYGFMAMIIMIFCFGCAGSMPVPIEALDAGARQASLELLESADTGDIEKISFALYKGAKIDVIDSDGNTPLIRAAIGGHLSAVRFLLDEGADPDIPGQDNKSALSHAMDAGKDDVAKLLLNTDISLLQRRYLIRNIQYSVDDGDVEAVRLALLLGADPNTRNQHNWTILMSAVWKGYDEIAELLLNAGADPDLTDKDGWTALMVATNMDDLPMVKLLHRHGADLEQFHGECRSRNWDCYFVTTLFYALPKPEILRYLVDNGAEIRSVNLTPAPLIVLRKGLPEESLRILLQAIRKSPDHKMLMDDVHEESEECEWDEIRRILDELSDSPKEVTGIEKENQETSSPAPHGVTEGVNQEGVK